MLTSLRRGWLLAGFVVLGCSEASTSPDAPEGEAGSDDTSVDSVPADGQTSFDTSIDTSVPSDTAADSDHEPPTDTASDTGDGASEVATDASPAEASVDADASPPSCAVCEKMNAKPVVFGGTFVRYAVLSDARIFWTASTSSNDNSSIFSLEKTSTLGTPKDHKAYAYTKRELTVHDGALYWFDKASDSTYIAVGRLTFATDVSDRVVFEKDTGGYLKSLDYRGLFSDGAAPLVYSIAKSVYALPTGAPPGPAGTPSFTVASGYGIALSGADASSYYGSWDWGGGSFGQSLVRIDRSTHALTEMVSTTATPRVLLVDATDVYYASSTGSGGQVFRVAKAATKVKGTVVAAVPANALVYGVAPSNVCWAEEGKPDLHCLDVATGVTTDRPTGPLAVDAVIGDATNHYFFSRAPGTGASDRLFDAYRVPK